jgi:hypothetical protein
MTKRFLNAFVDAACMNWSGNLFQTFATRIGKLFFLKLVLNRCWTILLLFLLLNLFPELESSFKKELASRSYFSFMSLYVSIISPLILLWKNRLDKYWESEEIYYSNHRAEISGGNGSDIQLPDIDIIGESGEVELPFALYFFFWSLSCLFFFDIRILITSLVSSNSSSKV